MKTRPRLPPSDDPKINYERAKQRKIYWRKKLAALAAKPTTEIPKENHV